MNEYEKQRLRELLDDGGMLSVGAIVRSKTMEEEKPKRYWTGDVGENDDFGYPIKMVFTDGRTKMGPWAIMNPQSWVNHGCGKLGTGGGQRYVKQADGKWLKVEG